MEKLARPRWPSVALTYVGAVVGAGFASGQEIWQFFGRHGRLGLAGLALAGLFLFVGGYLALEHGRNGVENIEALMTITFSPRIAVLAEGATAGFLWVGLATAVAGGGAAMRQFLAWPERVGQLVTLAAILALAARGPKGVLAANALLVPYIVGLTLLVGVIAPVSASGQGIGARGWFLSAFLYVSYNVFTGVVVLLTVGRNLSGHQESLAAAGMAALLMTGMAGIEWRVVTALTGSPSLPMLAAAGATHALLGLLYGVSLWVALLTTGVAQAFVLLSRFGKRGLLGLVAIPWLAGVGFPTLVGTAYPVMGIFSAILWVPLIRGRCTARRHPPGRTFR
ncbi:MAG: hypothetical protein M0Z53_13820 [Thermaerobacter sp.]|nr:hypothetical protein [Thermaerobacter sp.]